jgi:hypothetical protein
MSQQPPPPQPPAAASGSEDQVVPSTPPEEPAQPTSNALGPMRAERRAREERRAQDSTIPYPIDLANRLQPDMDLGLIM